MVKYSLARVYVCINDMSNSRTKNSVLNMATSVAIRFFTLILSFVSRTVFIYILGAEYLGLNGLFTNILSFLALSELGLGSAIAFLLYKPIAENDIERMKTVMHFYKKCYMVVGTVILLLGCCLMPFLKYLVNFDQPIPDNLYLVFFLFVLQSAVSYFFAAYKQTFVNANQKTYVLTKIELVFTVVNCIVDIVVLLLFRNFIVYLVGKVIVVIIKNLVLSKKIDSLYPFLTESVSQYLTRSEVKNVFKDIYSVSVFRLGSVLFNSVSNIVTSALVGTIVVGYYSNYTMIVTQIEMVMMLAFNAVAASIGNVVATESKDKQYSVFKRLDSLTFIIYGACTVFLIQCLNSFIQIWIGENDSDYVLNQIVVILICANFYINCSAQVMERFRVASGNFHIGRDLQVIGGVVNIILSVILAKTYGFEGVLIAPLISKIFVTTTPYVINVGKAVFGIEWIKMLKDYFGKIAYIALLSTLCWFACFHFHMHGIKSFAIEIIITVLIVLIVSYLTFRNTEVYFEIRNLIKKIFKA